MENLQAFARTLNPSLALLFLAFVFVIVLFDIVVLKNLHFSKLHSIPGPSLAAASGLWLWIQDLTARTPKAIRQLHAEYGAIVRIGPNEISINDTGVYNDVLYRQAPTFLKAPDFYRVFSAMEESNGLLSHGFSRQEVLVYQAQIWEAVNIMTAVLGLEYTAGAPVELSKMFRSLTLDVISKFVYGESFGSLLIPKFQDDVLNAFDRFQPANFFVRLFHCRLQKGTLLIVSKFMMFPKVQNVVAPILGRLPSKLFRAIPRMRERVVTGLQLLRNSKDKASAGFQPLLASEMESGARNNIPVTEARLITDGMGSILAGTDTTGFTLAVATWAIFSNETIYRRLNEELRTIWPDGAAHPELQDLEKLPYLRACVKESLRLATPIRGRLPRICPSIGWTYAGHYIPAGVTVSSSSYLMHYNEDVFPSPDVLDPERWLITDEAMLKLRERHFVPFSKGARGCIGLNLALAEVYIALATVVRRFRVVEVVDKELVTSEMFATMLPRGQRVIIQKAED